MSKFCTFHYEWVSSALLVSLQANDVSFVLLATGEKLPTAIAWVLVWLVSVTVTALNAIRAAGHVWTARTTQRDTRASAVPLTFLALPTFPAMQVRASHVAVMLWGQCTSMTVWPLVITPAENACASQVWQVKGATPVWTRFTALVKVAAEVSSKAHLLCFSCSSRSSTKSISSSCPQKTFCVCTGEISFLAKTAKLHAYVAGGSLVAAVCWDLNMLLNSLRQFSG